MDAVQPSRLVVLVTIVAALRGMLFPGRAKTTMLTLPPTSIERCSEVAKSRLIPLSTSASVALAVTRCGGRAVVVRSRFDREMYVPYDSLWELC